MITRNHENLSYLCGVKVKIPKDMREKIRTLLKERKITQACFAEKIGIAPQTLRAYLCGHNKLTNTMLEKFARGLNMTVTELKDTGCDEDAIDETTAPDNVAFVVCPYCHRKHAVILTPKP